MTQEQLGVAAHCRCCPTPETILPRTDRYAKGGNSKLKGKVRLPTRYKARIEEANNSVSAEGAVWVRRRRAGWLVCRLGITISSWLRREDAQHPLLSWVAECVRSGLSAIQAPAPRTVPSAQTRQLHTRLGKPFSALASLWHRR